jgi:hypothetical protein
MYRRRILCTLYGAVDPDPGSQIQKQQQKRGVKQNLLPNFFNFVATNFTKLKIILVLRSWRKNLAQFSKKYRTFTQNIVTKLSKIWVWDPASENLFRIPYPGVKKAPDPGSRNRIRNTVQKYRIVWGGNLYSLLDWAVYTVVVRKVEGEGETAATFSLVKLNHIALRPAGYSNVNCVSKIAKWVVTCILLTRCIDNKYDQLQ